MSDEAPAGFEEPLLETRQGPVLDSHGENESAQEIAEVVGDHPEEQPHLIGPEPVTGEAGPVGGGLALLDPLLGRPALVVEADDCSVRPKRGDDEAYSGKQFTEVMLDLGDHAARAVPGGGLIVEAAVADQRGVARLAARPSEQVPDDPLKDVVGWQANRISHTSSFERLIDRGRGERRVGPDDDGVALRAVPVNNGRSTSSHPAALWTLPGRSLAARQSPCWLKTKRGW